MVDGWMDYGWTCVDKKKEKVVSWDGWVLAHELSEKYTESMVS